MWWEGPNFLKDGNFIVQKEPIENSISKEHLLSEIKILVVNKAREYIIDISKFNSLSKLYRVTAWIKRFVNNVRFKKERFSWQSLIRNILRKFKLCRLLEGPCYSYPTTPPLTKLGWENNYAIHVFGTDNFGPLYVNDTFDKNSHELTA